MNFAETLPARSDLALGKLTRREFRERMERGDLKACIIPVGAIEQHLEHLAMEHDWRSARHLAFLIAERLRPHVLVVETFMVGVSEKHMVHPGTITFRPGTFLSALTDVIESVARAGFRHVLVLNGHGSNNPTTGFWDPLVRLFKINLQFVTYWDLLTAAEARDLLKSGNLPGHAQEFETSFALAAFAENVRTEVLRDQEDPTPSFARAETGQAFIHLLADRLSQHVEKMIAGGRD